MTTVDQNELGRRLKAARTSCGLTEDDVAGHLGLARSAVTQIEQGNRAVAGLELHRLSDYFGRDMRDLLAEDFQEDDILGALFRSQPDLSGRHDLHEALVSSLALGRELTNLERILEIDQNLGAAAAYPLPEERRRLGVLLALFRLKSLKSLTEAQLDALRKQDQAGVWKQIARFLDLPEPDHQAKRNEFRQRFLGLALEAYRREEISKRKLIKLAERVAVSERDVDAMLESMGLDEEEVVDVLPLLPHRL